LLKTCPLEFKAEIRDNMVSLRRVLRILVDLLIQRTISKCPLISDNSFLYLCK
jgi:hypothetical protein